MSTIKRRPRRHRLFIIAVSMGLVAVACSNSDGEAGNKAIPPSSSGSDEATGTTAGVNLDEHVEIAGVPGVTDDEIRYSVLATESNNILGTCIMRCYLDGIEAYFNWRNSEGGIFGRHLVVSDVVDDEFGQNQVKALEITSADDTFGTFSATNLATGWEALADAGVPTYVWAINMVEMTAQEPIWGNREVVCVTCTRRSVAYVAKVASAKKVASLGYGVSEISKQCAQSNADSIEQYRADIGGAEVAYTNDELAFGLPNGVGPEVTAMKEAGVDLVFACLDNNGMKTIGQELERQGMQDVVLFHSNSYDSDFVGESGGIFEGDYVQSLSRPFEADAGSSPLDTYKEWMAKDGKALTEISLVGWENADLAYQGLKAAGPNFDRPKVIAATNTFTDYTASGLTQPVDWSRQHEPWTQDDFVTHGSEFECTVLVQIKEGTFELIGDADKPWVCWPGDTDEWSEPTPMNFE